MSNQQARNELKEILGTIEEHTEAKKRLWELFRRMKAPVVQQEIITVPDPQVDTLRLELERFKAQARSSKFRERQYELALANAQRIPEVNLSHIDEEMEHILKGHLDTDLIGRQWLDFVKGVVGEPWASRLDRRHITPTLHLAADGLTFFQRLTGAMNGSRRFFRVISKAG